jgi:glycine dehydrogenase subunit 2
LPALSEPEAMRHYVRLSQKNYAIDMGIYPLGSCTMKHNPRLNEAMARLPGFADIHPLQPISSVPGALELIHELGRWLMELTGMQAVAMSPKAGAHGELCGMMAIKAALSARGETRSVVLVPESAHGTNPATAALLGYRVVGIPAGADGTVRAEEVERLLGEHDGQVAAIMLTNPNTCGIFEPQIVEIAEAVHAAAGYFYCDGANLNAIMARRSRAISASTPCTSTCTRPSPPRMAAAGRAPGRWCSRTRSRPFAPVPFVQRDGESSGSSSMRRQRRGAARPHDGVPRARWACSCAPAWMLSHGSDGMRQASEDAVLNANYVRARLQDIMTVSFPDHRDARGAVRRPFPEGHGRDTLDFAKAMIDEGYHPMTMYFPLVVHGAMLIEPTESESRASLDLFIAALRDLVFAARDGDTKRFTRRLDMRPAAAR